MSSVIVMQPLISALIEGERLETLIAVKRLRAIGLSRERIITEGVETAMAALDEKCTLEQFNLLEIMLVGRALSSVVDFLYPEGSQPPKTKGTVVIASLHGDIHDIGKKIVIMVLGANGYRVIDCGKDCSVDTLVNTAINEDAMAVMVSGLITSVIPQVRQLRAALTEKGDGHVKVLAGGAALKQATAQDLQVDYVAQTAFDGFHFLSGKP